MPKADTSVKWFHSDMPNSPILRGEPGALIELLDACLISGFDPRTPDSITVAGEVATVTLGGGNPYEKHAVITITGASVAGLNAEWRIATSGATSLTFACPGVADGPATGATVKRAPAGWAKPFSDVNVGVYQSLDPASTQLYLRLDDADPKWSRVRGYEQMTDANTGLGPFPTIEQFALTKWTWPKSYTTSTLARSWALVADGRFFYWFPMWRENTVTSPDNCASVQFFGDIAEFEPSDRYACMICAHSESSLSLPMEYHPGVSGGVYAGYYGHFAARRASQLGGSALTRISYPSGGGNWGGYGVPALADDGLVLGAPGLVLDGESSVSPLRGMMPGTSASAARKSSEAERWSVVEIGDGAVLLGVRSALLPRSSGPLGGSWDYVAMCYLRIDRAWR